VLAAILCGESTLHARPSVHQIESVPGSSENYVWVSSARVDGHLAVNYSPAGAFSPDSSILAVANKDKVVLSNLAKGNIKNVLHPRLKNLRDLNIESASFLDANTLFLLGTAIVHEKKEPDRPTPLLGFLWNIQQDALDGEISVFGAKGGFGRPRYFPRIKYLGMYKDSSFVLWSPVTRKAGEIKIPELTREPHLYSFSPNGQWLLLAQISGGGSPNPIVVQLNEHKFVDVLSGYQGTVLSIRFSNDGTKLVTASADGEVRIWSVPEWKLLETLSGHKGPVRWAEFSPHGRLIVSGGEDETVRIWSADDGKLIQTLSESHAPLDTVSFSPDGNYVAASTDRSVLIWKKTPTGP
jgi:WD40 repeat protein